MITRSRWIRATSLGWVGGIVLILVLSGLFDAVGLEGFQFYIGLGMGGGVGLAQWFVLRKSGIVSQWVWMSVSGLSIPFFLNDLLGQFINKPFGDNYLPVSVLLGSALISVFQYIVLKDYATAAKRWIGISLLGWLMASLSVMAVDYTKYVSSNNMVLFAMNLTLILIGGFLLGLITGRTITGMLRASADH